MRRSTSWRRRLHTAFLIVVGLGLIVLGGRQYWLGSRGSTFLNVDGTILRSDVVQLGKAFKPQIAYSCAVDHQRFEGHSVGPLEDFGTETWALELAGRYVPGTPTQVFFDPDDPRDSMLIPELRTSDKSIISLYGVIGVLALVCGTVRATAFEY